MNCCENKRRGIYDHDIHASEYLVIKCISKYSAVQSGHLSIVATMVEQKCLKVDFDNFLFPLVYVFLSPLSLSVYILIWPIWLWISNRLYVQLSKSALGFYWVIYWAHHLDLALISWWVWYVTSILYSVLIFEGPSWCRMWSDVFISFVQN